MSIHRAVVGLLIGLILGVSGCRNEQRIAPSSAVAATWAQPIAAPGLPNLHQVSGNLYRGAQPSPEGFLALEKMGVKTIVNLRTGDNDRKTLRGLSFAYEFRPMHAFSPRDEDIIWFLRLVTDAARGPVFVHCHRGADRCGLLSAMYRVVIEGWSKEQAIAEMTRGGMGFHSLYGNLIDYVRKADVERMRVAVGHEPATTLARGNDREAATRSSTRGATPDVDARRMTD